MALTKLGTLLTLCENRNADFGYALDNVRGISIQKKFIETKADMTNVSLSPYFVVAPNDFAYVTVTSRNGEKITIAHNDTENTYLVSSSYVVFKVSRPEILHPDYLFMWFNRPEFDRYARFNSWGSARETFSWEDMCDIDIDLPPLPIQQKYVSIYNAMLANQRSYERGLEDLKLVCEGYMDELHRKYHSVSIGEYIELIEERNDGLEYGLESVKGVSIGKVFIDTKADMEGVNLKPYYVVRPKEFAYVTVTSRNGEKISLAMNESDNTYICSSSYVVFKVRNENTLWPPFLMLFLSRSEFNRYARFNSWGSAREIFDWSEMCDVKIPLPEISVQKSLAEIYRSYRVRAEISAKLQAQIKSICPILIKGSLEEGQSL